MDKRRQKVRSGGGVVVARATAECMRARETGAI
jgi:hypothetical protein